MSAAFVLRFPSLDDHSILTAVSMHHRFSRRGPDFPRAGLLTTRNLHLVECFFLSPSQANFADVDVTQEIIIDGNKKILFWCGGGSSQDAVECTTKAAASVSSSSDHLADYASTTAAAIDYCADAEKHAQGTGKMVWDCSPETETPDLFGGECEIHIRAGITCVEACILGGGECRAAYADVVGENGNNCEKHDTRDCNSSKSVCRCGHSTTSTSSTTAVRTTTTSTTSTTSTRITTITGPLYTLPYGKGICARGGDHQWSNDGEKGVLNCNAACCKKRCDEMFECIA